MKRRPLIFKERVDELFGYPNGYCENRERGVVEFSASDVSYEKLCSLSEMLGTTKISLWARDEGGCPTCGSDMVTVVEASEVNFG